MKEDRRVETQSGDYYALLLTWQNNEIMASELEGISRDSLEECPALRQLT